MIAAVEVLQTNIFMKKENILKRKPQKKKGKENKQTKTQLRPFPSSPPHIVIPATLSAIGPEEEKRRGHIPGTVKKQQFRILYICLERKCFLFSYPNWFIYLKWF